jgi:predicted nuclease of restriction endonuclease-like RecB superfamily
MTKRFGKAKFGNIKTGKYDSKKESQYATGLKLQMQIDNSPNSETPSYERITNIEEQVVYTLIPAQRGADGKIKERACKYIADFRITYGSGRTVVVDVKGFRTADYVIKRKLMLHMYNIEIKEV